MSSFNSRAAKQNLVRPDAAFELASLPPTQIAAKWDKASKLQRCDILSTFVERFHSNTAAEIERSFGGGAQLFFARITATLRLSYKTMAASCDRFGILMLMTIGLFLQGQKFLTSFAEVGGIQLLCDFVASIPNCGVGSGLNNSIENYKKILNETTDDIDAPSFTPEKKKKLLLSQQNSLQQQATIEAAAKTRAIRLLIHIANSGRVYREMICEDGGLSHLVNATSFESDDGVLELTGSLFLSLGHGNPRRVRDVHGALLHIARTGNDNAALCAASTLRALQVARIGPTGAGGFIGATAEIENNTSNANNTKTASRSIGMILPGPETNNLPTPGQERNDDYEDEDNNGEKINDHEVPAHLAGALVSPIRLAGPNPTSAAAANAENEAGLALYMDSLFHLLRSPSIRVRFEGIELLSLSAPGQGLLGPMLRRCVDILDDVDTTLHAISALPFERERAFINLHASCVRLVYALITHKDQRVALETARVFEIRLLHLCLGRFIRVTQEAHNRSILSQSAVVGPSSSSLLSLSSSAYSPQSLKNQNVNNSSSKNNNNNNNLSTTTSASRGTTAAPGVQDAVRIFKAILVGEGCLSYDAAVSAGEVAASHVDRLRKAVEIWLRKTLGDDIFAPLLDPNSALNDPYVLIIAEKLSDANKQQLDDEEKLEKEREEKESAAMATRN